MSGDMTHEEHGAVAAHEHGHGVVAEGNPFADPGLPEHLPRLTDIDEKAAKRSERIVAGLFIWTFGLIALLLFAVWIAAHTTKASAERIAQAQAAAESKKGGE